MNNSPTAIVAIAIVMAVIISIAFTSGFAMSDWKHTTERKVDSESLIANGYGTISGERGYLSILYSKDWDSAVKEVAKRNARNFIDDKKGQDELVKVFYRRVK